MLHNYNDLKSKNNSINKNTESNKEDILTSSVNENIQMISNNENLFKIVVTIIACLNKLHHTGNSNLIYRL